MSEQAIVEKIIADAKSEAEAIIANAQKNADETISQARLRAQRRIEGEKAASAKRAEAIMDGKAATARLDSAKILLAEKRAVIDEIYARALNELNSLSKAECLRFIAILLDDFAEEGDTIVFAENFAYVKEAAKLDVITQKKLKVSPERAQIKGGMLLYGKDCDKDLSYEAILADDREEHQAEIAAEIFSV